MTYLFNSSKYFILMVLTAFALLSVSQVAEAKRFGGAKSFGYSKQVAPKNYNTAPKTAPAKTAPAKTAPTSTAPKGATAPAKSGASKWLGPLAGIAAGGLIAAMLFGDGFDGIQLFDILLFALIAFVLFKLFARRVQQSNQGSYAPAEAQVPQQTAYRETHKPELNSGSGNNGGSIIGADLEDGMGQGVSNEAVYLSEVPAWFDEKSFVDGAKQHFVTLQKSWDEVDLTEIESYCAPELFSALQKELRGVEPGDNHTVVDTLEAEVAAMAVDGEYFVVSIRFTGFIEEDVVQGAHAFNEVWHIRRLASDQGNWQIAGIQQGNASL